MWRKGLHHLRMTHNWPRTRMTAGLTIGCVGELKDNRLGNIQNYYRVLWWETLLNKKLDSHLVASKLLETAALSRVGWQARRFVLGEQDHSTRSSMGHFQGPIWKGAWLRRKGLRASVHRDPGVCRTEVESTEASSESWSIRTWWSGHSVAPQTGVN